MRKADIVRRIAQATDLTLVKAEDVVDAVFDEMKHALQQDDAVILDQREHLDQKVWFGKTREVHRRKIKGLRAL